MVLIVSCESFVGFEPALHTSKYSIHDLNMDLKENGRTKLARCLVMHSSYNSGDQGENLNFIFETRSRVSGGSIVPLMSL